MNRFSTHILEDIQSCVVEGLTITDEKMNIVPLLAAEMPTLENGGVTLRPDGGMDVTWKLRPGVKWHDGTPLTSADVKFTVDAINDPGLQPGEHRRLRPHRLVDTPDPLTAVVHYNEVYAPYEMQFFRGMLPKHVLAGPRHRSRERLQPQPARHRPVPVAEWKTGEYILLERVPNTGAAPNIRRSTAALPVRRQHEHAHQPAEERRGPRRRAVPVGQVREIAAMPTLSVNHTPGNAYEHVTLNERQLPAFTDVRVRRALSTRSIASSSCARSSTAWRR